MRQDFYTTDLGGRLAILEEELEQTGQKITGIMGARLPGEDTWHVTVVTTKVTVDGEKK